MSGNADLVTSYVAERPRYAAVVNEVAETLRAQFRFAGIASPVSGREKDPWSLATKLLTKERAGRPYRSLMEIPDLAGVRIVARTLSEFESAKVAIRTLFPTAAEDDKSASLDPDTFRYRDIHYQVYPEFQSEDLTGLGCEVQLRTGAENLWSDLSHELFYKTPGPVSPGLLRRFNRLVAIVELFDLEVAGTMNALAADPSSHGREILATLEGHFIAAMPHPVGINRELSLELIESISNVAPLRADLKDLSTRLADFVAANSEKLRNIYTRVIDHPGRNPFFVQPESLLIWFLFENHKHSLIDEWQDHNWDEELLNELGNEWGIVPID